MKGLYWFTFIIVFVFQAVSAQAEEKRALVIGNGGYHHLSKLKNPVNDAKAITETLRLRKLGFQVTELHNRNRKQMAKAISQFGRSIKPNSVVLVYFAGHGAQYQGENYLFPVDFNTQDEKELPIEAVSTAFIMDHLKSNTNGLNILVLDACRNNPLSSSGRTGARGLARIENAPPNTYSIYATSPGKIANDNPNGVNGLFTKYLVEYMKQPGLSLSDMVLETRKDVMKASQNQQVPYDYGTLTRKFCMSGCETVTGGVSPAVVIKPVVRTEPKPVVVARPKPTNNLHSHNGRSHSHALPVEGVNHQHGASVSAVVSRPTTVTVKSKPIEPEMVFIKGGTLMMGSPANEPDRSDDEGQHSVTIGSFYMGKKEVTNEEYDRCVDVKACKPPVWKRKGSISNLQNGIAKTDYQGSTNPLQPVVGVSFEDAQSYTVWLSSVTERKYSLPTEAEWEYAARAGSRTAYSSGNSSNRNKANFGAEYCCRGELSGADRWFRASPVGSFPANKLGLLDMYGNVAEFTCSEYEAAYSGKEKVCTNGKDLRLISVRGGSWFNPPKESRLAFRSSRHFSNSDPYQGFRLSMKP